MDRATARGLWPHVRHRHSGAGPERPQIHVARCRLRCGLAGAGRRAGVATALAWRTSPLVPHDRARDPDGRRRTAAYNRTAGRTIAMGLAATHAPGDWPSDAASAHHAALDLAERGPQRDAPARGRDLGLARPGPVRCCRRECLPAPGAASELFPHRDPVLVVGIPTQRDRRRRLARVRDDATPPASSAR